MGDVSGERSVGARETQKYKAQLLGHYQINFPLQLRLTLSNVRYRGKCCWGEL